MSYVNASKILGLNIKMLMRYDKNQSISARSIAIIETFLSKYLTDIPYKAKIDYILHNSTNTVNDFNAISIQALTPIVGNLVDRFVKLQLDLNEVYELLESIVDQIEILSQKGDNYQISALTSLTNRLSEDIEKLKANNTAFYLKPSTNVIKTNIPDDMFDDDDFIIN